MTILEMLNWEFGTNLDPPELERILETEIRPLRDRHEVVDIVNKLLEMAFPSKELQKEHLVKMHVFEAGLLCGYLHGKYGRRIPEWEGGGEE